MKSEEGKIRILIVEDDPIIAEDLAGFMQDFGYIALKPVDNAEDALKSIKNDSPDLILFDVHLGSEIDGIELARMVKLKYRIPFIFLTAFNDQDTFERIRDTEPSAYLVKPVDERNLQSSIAIALFNFANNAKAADPTKETPSGAKVHDFVSGDYIFIKVKQELRKLGLADILYAEAYDNYAFLHTQSDRYIVSASLKNVEAKLPEDRFVRTHRSYIVNLSKIDRIEENTLHIGKHPIPIGKTYRDDLMKRINLI